MTSQEGRVRSPLVPSRCHNNSGAALGRCPYSARGPTMGGRNRLPGREPGSDSASASAFPPCKAQCH